MLYFLGNCQSDFLGRSMQRRGHDTTYRVLASPLTLPSHEGGIPESLAALDRDHLLGDYFHGRELTHQFQPIGPDDPAPRAIVLNLHHENTPLFVHNTEGYVFFMDPRALTDKPEVMAWVQSNCRMFKPNPATYLDRFAKMLTRLHVEFSDVPIVVLSRLAHAPAFGPDPFSYLEEWSSLWQRADETLTTWAKALDSVHILDMNRVFGGIWNASDTPIDALCPFLKIKLEATDGQVTGLHAQRDIEHIGPMPDRLADKLEAFLQTGTIEYTPEETITRKWNRPWRPTRQPRNTLLEKLASGANYQSAEAVASFFMDLETDYTPLLAQARERMPVCHMTLHMIKAYGRIHPTADLAAWCEAHLEAASRFTANGPLYREAYMDRVEAMRRHALSDGAKPAPVR